MTHPTYFLYCLLATMALAGCQHDPKSSSGKTNQGMQKSSGQFTKGYQTGMKEAQKSWGDWNGASMWLWMADAQYKQGYDRGWNDGRAMVKLRKNQKSQLGTREPLTPTPSLLKQQQAQQVENTKPAPATPQKKKASKE